MDVVLVLERQRGVGEESSKMASFYHVQPSTHCISFPRFLSFTVPCPQPHRDETGAYIPRTIAQCVIIYLTCPITTHISLVGTTGSHLTCHT